MKQRRALITGITGQDGSYLAELLLQKGYSVTGVTSGASDRHRLSSVEESIEWVKGDITDEAFVRRKVEAGRKDMRAGRGRTHAEVEAEFATHRAQLLRKAGKAGA